MIEPTGGEPMNPRIWHPMFDGDPETGWALHHSDQGERATISFRDRAFDWKVWRIIPDRRHAEIGSGRAESFGEADRAVGTCLAAGRSEPPTAPRHDPNAFTGRLESPDGHVAAAAVAGRIWLVRYVYEGSPREIRSYEGWFRSPDGVESAWCGGRFSLVVDEAGIVPVILWAVGNGRPEFRAAGPPEFAEGGRPIPTRSAAPGDGHPAEYDAK